LEHRLNSGVQICNESMLYFAYIFITCKLKCAEPIIEQPNIIYIGGSWSSETLNTSLV
jgi:hypothetical protein